MPDFSSQTLNWFTPRCVALVLILHWLSCAWANALVSAVRMIWSCCRSTVLCRVGECAWTRTITQKRRSESSVDTSPITYPAPPRRKNSSDRWEHTTSRFTSSAGVNINTVILIIIDVMVTLYNVTLNYEWTILLEHLLILVNFRIY